MGVARINRRKASQVRESRLSHTEAVAVLQELHFQAERRLIDACQDFQDIAIEMQWRLSNWQALLDQRVHLQRDIERANSLRSRFNVGSRLRTGRTPQDPAWARHQRRLRANLLRHEDMVAAAVAGIVMRNDEGTALEREIENLQQRCQRIETALKGLRRPPMLQSQQERAAGMARLVFELSEEPDIGNIASLLLASELIDERLHG